MLWRTAGNGTIRARWEILTGSRRGGLASALPGLLARGRRHLEVVGFPATEVTAVGHAQTLPRAWAQGRFGWTSPHRVFVVPASVAAAAVIPPRCPKTAADLPVERHTVVIGSTGSGKTSLLTTLASAALQKGFRLVVVDLHGDLAPRVVQEVARGPPVAGGRLVAIDPTHPGTGIGLEILPPGSPVEREHAAVQTVATLRRLSSENGDLYWGFRLERIFDAFVRLALEEGGTLLDVYALLTDERRREASRLRSRDPAIARFLEELAPIVRRNPEFLWPAASRLTKMVHDRRLRALLANRAGGLDADHLLGAGRSIIVRIPLGEFGPEGAGFAASLVVGRLYHALVRRANSSRAPPDRTLLLLDEAHLFSPRLLADVLAEGRKFGVAAVLATQYPDRLPADLRGAAEGSAGTHVVFRMPPASAAVAGQWLGLDPEESRRLIPALPPGTASVVSAGAEFHGRLLRLPTPAPVDPEFWARCVSETQEEYGRAFGPGENAEVDDRGEEDWLFSAYCAEESGAPLTLSALAAPPRGGDPGALETVGSVHALLARGDLCVVSGTLRVTASGRRFLGVDRPTGAARESTIHRALIFATVRLFARHGARLEVVRQGRFDTRLPDAIFRQLGDSPPTSPAELARVIDRRRGSWAWRLFQGRDVFVEVEVSGALRPVRVRRALAKARDAGAFVLFITPDSARSERVRRVLREGRPEWPFAQVWRLGPEAPSPGRTPPTESISVDSR